MTRVHDNSAKGYERRFNYAVEHLMLDMSEMVEEVGPSVVLAALFSVLRDTAREMGMAPCQYQMFLIDELALMNTMRRTGKSEIPKE